MASPQCLENTNKKVTKDICFPNPDQIVRKIGKIVKKTNITKIYVATDKNPMIKEIENFLAKYSVKVYHNDPWLPVIDVAILGKSDYFIGIY
jgi:peptide-O-fucosyltransferase